VNAHMLSQTAPIDLEAVSGALYRHQRRGRRFSANCVVLRGSDLRLSNDMRLEELPVEITIFETARMKDQLAKLPQGALGSFHFTKRYVRTLTFRDLTRSYQDGSC
jgi:hypothetical protein